MCGIAGIVNFSIDKPDENTVRNMISVLRHRGPDDDGIYNDRHVVLGHVRLSIIDVTGNKQPLSNENGSIWVTFNGEIYNYSSVRKDLIGRGHVFKTEGDTEVLVHLYEEYGKDMVQYLQGMFAFAIWDKRNHELFIARDRLGIKPLYYCQQGNDFMFASEPKAFFQHPGVCVRPSEEGIWHYLTYRSVPAPRTMFENISKLRAGFALLVTKKGCAETCYWDIPLRSERPDQLKNYETGDLTLKSDALLLASVKRHLISDVPLGSFLSGGVDSSLIVAMMSRMTDVPVHTYSVGFSNPAYSELPYAKVVANLYKTDHHELVIDEDCFGEHLDKLTWMRDAPLSEPADIPLYLLSKTAARDVKVLLSGEGGDELFGGYPKYAFDRLSCVLNLLPKRFTQSIGHQLPARFRKIEVAMRSLCEKDAADRWAQWFAPFTKEEKAGLVLSQNSWPNPTREYVEKAKGSDALDAMLYTDCKIWLPDNLLDRGDRMTMGASLECRVPFLDHEVVEFAFRLRPSVKVKMFTRKWLIKQVALKYLPEQIVYRRKVGFSVPLAQWFRNRLRDMSYDRICERNGFVRQLLDYNKLKQILDEHNSGLKDNSLKIWTLLGLAIWGSVFCNEHAVKHN